MNFMRRLPAGERISVRQQEFLEFLAGYEKRNGVSPTFREIALGMNITSKGSVSAMIDMLVKKGVVQRDDRVVRGLHVR
jgi:repressor LexA